MACREKGGATSLKTSLSSSSNPPPSWDWGLPTSGDLEVGQWKVTLEDEQVRVVPDAAGSDVGLGSRTTKVSIHSDHSSHVGAGSSSPSGAVYDIFLSHLQRNGQDAVISLQMFIAQLRPDLRCFIDLDVDMNGDLTGTLMEGVANCRVFLFFITDGVLNSPWCLQEIRWAVEYQKQIVLVRETDTRHGGIEMNDFMKQVPPDLTETFSNIIAIPWYRQPAFRAVSVDSILKACALEDTFAEDMKTLDEMRLGLNVVAKSSVGRMSCFDFISEHSFGMRLLFFFGGFQRFRNETIDTLYTIIFGASYASCAIVCWINVVYQGFPFHHLMTDLTTAYAHLPAIQAWYMWRQFVRTNACDELLYMAIRDDQEAALLARLCRYGGWIALTIQIFLVADVWGGLSMAWTASELDILGAPESHTVGHFHEAGLTAFSAVHSITMWVVIPPTVASFFASHLMFVFIAGLHIFDLRRLARQIIVCMSTVANFFTQHKAMNDAQSVGTSDSRATHRTSGQSAGSKGEYEKKRFAMERELSDLVVDVIRMMFNSVQDRIDKTCEYTNGTWSHLLVLSTIEILAVRASILYHLDGGAPQDYTWWFLCVDLWHLGGGTFLLIASLSFFAGVTAQLRQLARRLAKQADQAGCSMDMQAKMLSFLSPTNLGMHMFGASIYVDAPQVGVICFVTFTIVGSLLMSLMNHLNDLWE